MGLTLPSELTEPLSWLGLTWPEADEDLLRAAGEEWIRFSEELSAPADRANSAAESVWSTTTGDAATAFQTWWTQDDGPRSRLADDAKAAALIGGALLAFAAITLTLKLAFIAQLGLLAIQIGQAVATAFVTLGATTAEIPGFIAASKLIMHKAIHEAMTKLQGLIATVFERARGLLRRVETRLARGKVPAKQGASTFFTRTRHWQNSTQEQFRSEFPDLGHGINNGYHRGPAFQTNCQSCVVATDHSLAGVPSSAVPRAADPLDPRFDWPAGVDRALGGGHTLRPASGYDDIASELTAAGPGSRGIVHGIRVAPDGTPVPGHVFNAVNRNGTVHFVDGQTGGYAYLENYADFQFMRTN